MKKLFLLVCVVTLSSCNLFPIPLDPNIPSGCRNFAMSTWVSNAAPWNELDWNNIGHIDEPLLSLWGWPGDILKAEDVCGPVGIGMVKTKIAAIRATGKMVWLNWSSEEVLAVAIMCKGEPIGLDADVVSVDAYGGPWDWYLKTKPILEYLLANLEPGQKMGLVPEGHYAPAWGVTHSQDDYVKINKLFFDWAMRHDDAGTIFAMAPFNWGPCKNDLTQDLCIADQPYLVDALSKLASEHPLCETP